MGTQLSSLAIEPDAASPAWPPLHPTTSGEQRGHSQQVLGEGEAQSISWKLLHLPPLLEVMCTDTDGGERDGGKGREDGRGDDLARVTARYLNADCSAKPSSGHLGANVLSPLSCAARTEQEGSPSPGQVRTLPLPGGRSGGATSYTAPQGPCLTCVAVSECRTEGAAGRRDASCWSIYSGPRPADLAGGVFS